MEVVSLFSGCGGMDLGFEDAGFNVIWSNDFNDDACDTYLDNFGLEPERGDIRQITTFPKADVLVGCYPCQGFSLYGKRRKTDPRNYLFREFARAISAVRPKYFVAENVKGLLYGYGKDLFKEMLSTYKRRGYNVSYKLLNAKDYGVPQDRERVFIVGVRKDLNRTYEFPDATHGPDLKKHVTIRDAIGDFSKPKKGEVFEGGFSSHYMSRNRKKKWDEVSFTIQASGRHAPLHPSGGKMKKVGKDVCIFGKSPNRRFSFKEAAVIQSFPRTFGFSGLLNSKYQQIGNAVPPGLASVIAVSLD